MKRTLLLAVVVVSLLVSPVSARQWSYRTGCFSVEAELVDVKDGKVILKKEDGSSMTVPLSKLSLGDVRYIGETLKAAEAAVTGGKTESPHIPAAERASAPGPKQQPIAHVEPSKLRYQWKKGQTYVYRVKIEGQHGNRSERLAGDVTYKVKSVTDDEAELVVTQALNREGKSEPISVDLYSYPSMPNNEWWVWNMDMTSEVTIKVDPFGKVVYIEGHSDMPFLLGDLSQIMVERLATPKDGAWTIASETGVSSVAIRYPFYRYVQTYRNRRFREGVPATEKTDYEIVNQTGKLLTIAKHYELATPSMVADKPRFQATGDGKLTFDTERGVFASQDFSMQVAVRNATTTEEIPVRVTYRLLGEEETAKMAKETEEADKEKKRPMNEKDVESVLADLVSGDKQRVARSAKLLSEKAPPQPNAKVAKALESVMLSADFDGPTRQNAAKALKAWSNAESVPALITAVTSDEWPPVQSAAIEAMMQYKPESAIPAIAQQLSNGLTRSHASKALKAFGPAAEGAVLVFLESDDAWTQAEACKILQVIGTEKSLGAMEKLARDTHSMVAKAAQQARQAIKVRIQLKPK